MKKKNISSIVKKAAVVCCAAAMCIAGGTVSSLAAQENEPDADATQQESEAQIADTDIRELTLGSTVNGEMTWNDDDYEYPDILYRIDTPASGRLWFEVTTNYYGFEWQLLDSEGESVGYYNYGDFYYNSDLGTGKSSFSLDLSKGTYYLKIKSRASYYDYDYYRVSFTMRTAFTNANATETEPNNSYAQAMPLGKEGKIRGQFAIDDDMDIYKINISKKTRLNVTYNSDYAELYNFGIYDSGAQEIYSDNYIEEKNKSFSVILNPGMYYIKVVSDGDTYDHTGTGPYTLTYSTKQKLTADNITFNTQNYKYDGKTKNPGMSIMDNMGRYLVYGTDYVMSTPGGRTNVGTYTYKFSFKGDYTGYAEKSIYITPQALGAKSVKLSATKTVYNGRTKNPTIVVRTPSGTVLQKGRDYTVSVPGGRKKVGTYRYRITFRGNYKGTADKYMVVNPARTKITRLGKNRAGVRITWKKSGNASGYIIYRSTDGGSYRRIRTIKSGNTKSYFDKGAKARWTDYSYKVVVYKKVNGKTYKSSSSPEKTISRY